MYVYVDMKCLCSDMCAKSCACGLCEANLFCFKVDLVPIQIYCYT